VKHNLAQFLLKMCNKHPIHSNQMYNPFFIIGSGRSVNTLVRSILERHPDVHIPPETYVLGVIIRQYKKYSYLPWDILLKIILAEIEYYPEFDCFNISLRNLYNKLLSMPQEERTLASVLNNFYMFHTQHIKPHAIRWGDKTPLNTYYLNDIVSVFPDALFVNLIRDGRDVILSYLKMGRYKTIRECADRWQSSIEKAQNFAGHYPTQYMDLRYEDLVQSPQKSVASLCDFLGLEYFDFMLEQDKNDVYLGDVEKWNHHSNVKKPINTSSIEKWKKEFKSYEINEINQYISTVLERLNYK